LDETLLSWAGVYEPLIFCIGVVLLFSTERGRRRGRLDWTRRWGILCSYVVLLLSAAQVLFLCALVSVGIAAVFQSMPLKYQPGVTRAFVELSTAYLRYGAYPSEMSAVVCVAFSSIAILLACIPLFDALRSTIGGGAGGSGVGRGRIGAILLAPLALFALVHLAAALRYALGFSSLVSATEILRYGVYFWPRALVAPIAGLSASPSFSGASGPALGDFVTEAIKWSIVFAIAVWLTFAQLAVAWQGRKAKQHRPSPLGSRITVPNAE
jgi:hypothetical protein